MHSRMTLPPRLFLTGGLLLVLIAAQLPRVTAVSWDSEELEIFDLVEEINENFYTLMGVQPDCTLPELKRAFRNLSVAWHPDKNDGIDENNRFRKLVSVYEVLKDTSKRAKYDLVLKNGLPNWKSAMFYYRRVRKMGIAEMFAIVFVIVSVGQYVCSWAAYAERIYTAESIIGNRSKRTQKKGGASADFDAIIDQIPRPSVFNTLPFQIPRAIWRTPRACCDAYAQYKAYQLEQAALLAEERAEEEAQRQRDEDYVREKEAKKIGLKKRKEKFAAQEKTDDELQGFAKLQHIKKLESIQAATSRAAAVAAGGAAGAGGGGLWTDDDLTELIRLVKKHPGGTPARWETIAEQMNRTVTEITFMAAKMKEKSYRLPGQTTSTMATGSSVAESIVQDTKRLQQQQQQCEPTVADPEESTPVTSTSPAVWSQEQQRQLETAMTKHPRTDNGADRWVLVAAEVSGKTRDECVDRYKHLVQKLRSSKATSGEKPQAKQTAADGEDQCEVAGGGGKRRNKRKERKKNMDFSGDENEE